MLVIRSFPARCCETPRVPPKFLYGTDKALDSLGYGLRALAHPLPSAISGTFNETLTVDWRR